jgi:hypothetical protein
MGANLAPDATELSNADRVKLASLALDAKALPVREVTAVIYAYADPSERNPIHLVERRVRGVKDYLIQLGVSPQKIEVDQRVRRSRRDEGRGGRGPHGRVRSAVPSARMRLAL